MCVCVCARVRWCKSLYPPPPVSFPTPCRSPGGGGGRHLVNPKFFVAAYCVVVWVAVLWGTTTCIPCNFCACKCACTVGVWSPRGVVGDRHLVTIPQGVVGDRLPWGGERHGGGG